MACRRKAGFAFVLLSVGFLGPCTGAVALPPAAGTQPGAPVNAAHVTTLKPPSAPCGVALPVIGAVTGGICAAAGEVAGSVGGLVGEAAGSLAGGVLEQLATWIIGAATKITSFVSSEMRKTSTPQLESAWYEAQFAPMADLGAALGLLVTLIALASAAVRRSPEALAATIAGIARAGIGTGLVVALTVVGLGIADQISASVISSSPHAFWAAASSAWGTSGFGGFGSSALAMLIALIEVFAAIFVWLELIVRDAVIYVAVLFFPVALAAAIWPALAAWPGRLARLLVLFVALKPVALIVLSFAGNAAASGLSFSGGVSGSVGTILAATVILGLAAFSPWALMYLLAADSESAQASHGLRAAAASATTGQGGASVRTGGGIRNLAADGAGGSPAGGSAAGPGSGGRGPSAGPPTRGSGPATEGGSGPAGQNLDEGSLAVGAAAIGTGSVGAAAGVAMASSAGTPGQHEEGEGGGQSAPESASASLAPGPGSPGESYTGSSGTPSTAGEGRAGAGSTRLGHGGPDAASSPTDQRPDGADGAREAGGPPPLGDVPSPTAGASSVGAPDAATVSEKPVIGGA